MAEEGTRMSVEEFVEYYDDWAGDYDDENDCEEIRTCTSLIVEFVAAGPEDTVVDLGTGTGAVALELADEAGTVVGRDASERMLERAREKAAERGIENVEFGTGRFRDPNVEDVDAVVSNFAIHHLSDRAKREAIEAMAALEPRTVVLAGAMFFGDRDPEDPPYDPDKVYPATVGFLADALTDEGFALTAVEQVKEYFGVLAAERTGFE